MADPNHTTTIIGIAGSLRKGSFNAALLRAAAEATSPGTRIEIASIREIPLYDGDVETEKGIPEPVKTLKDRIASADGAPPGHARVQQLAAGVFKNAIDWLSRPAKDIRPRFREPTGRLDGSHTRTGRHSCWRRPPGCRSLRTLGLRPWFGARLARVGRGPSIRLCRQPGGRADPLQAEEFYRRL